MKKVKRIVAGIVAAVLFVSSAAMPAGAAAPWNVSGTYEFTFLLDGDVSNTPYVHHVTLAQTGSTVTGDGGFPATGGDTYHWNITSGTQTGDGLNLTALYDLGATGTVMHLTGTIAPSGAVSGTWDDDFGGSRTGTWSITKGASIPRIHTPANGATVTQAALTKVDWTDSVGSNPPFQYQYEAFSDAGYTVNVYSSGWLSASEIPTPGTPPGEYYLRVKARNASLDESAWSNGASDPYHITVVLNAFTIPAECDQNVVYNLIEGTNGSNILNGTNGPDLILAKGGSDLIDGKGGNDCIDGGSGSDVIKGGAGADVILGGADSDSILGEGGADYLYGEGGADAIKGGADNDNLFGGAGADALLGDGGMDTANGGAGADACSAETQTQCNP